MALRNFVAQGIFLKFLLISNVLCCEGSYVLCNTCNTENICLRNWKFYTLLYLSNYKIHAPSKIIK